MSTYNTKKIWLIGASEGIGEALAFRLAASSAQLALSARNKEKLEALSVRLPGAGNIIAPMDVTDSASVHRAWESLNSRWGGVDIVIYNAGTYEPMSARDFDLRKADTMLDVNFRGALRVLDCVIPPFVGQKRGHIVLVASVAAYRGLPRAIGYGASKAALLHLAENLHIDLNDLGIKVQAVCPGFVKTRLTDKNEFNMPFIISAETAAARIARGMAGSGFEIHFPRRFTMGLKLLGLLPRKLYLKVVSLL